MNYNESMEYINNFSHSGKKVVDLSRISNLLNRLDNPQKKLKFVHIAGTNGKGSVLEYCSNALINAGYKTGQFTSPYIITYCDRIRINGINIPKEKVAKICTRVKKTADNEFYSQFEITFAIALLYYVEEKCDIVFLETGIGGTLDATNIIENPIVSAVTSVSLDHTGILGDTVEEIAMHKLGIIKDNSPIVLSCNNKQSVKRLAFDIASEKNSSLIIPDIKQLDIIKSDIYSTEFKYKGNNYSLKMPGEHQIVNALTAIEMIEVIKENFNISSNDINKSLSESFINSRIEIIQHNPVIIIDGGHNQAGINSLIAVLKQSGIDKVTAIFGMVEGKAVDYAVNKLSNMIQKVYCVDGYIDNNIQSHILSEKFKITGTDSECFNCCDVMDNAIIYAKNNDTPILICGSLYLASYMKNLIGNNY